MQSILSLFLLLSASGLTISYPVFGTKRYTRANLIPPNDLGSMSMPIYSAIPQYYDSQPQYLPVPSYSISPGADYYDDNSYYNNNYYYMPQMQRRLSRQDHFLSYGMPTYRGEYKPTPYYYAHGPSYTYPDDRLESNNPLDDLHEEIMQEDERERARDYMPVGQEQWYENPTRQDNAFLRNLMIYNNQLNSVRNKQSETNDDEDFDEYEDPESSDYYEQPVSESRNTYPGFLNNNYNGNKNVFKLNNFRNNKIKNSVEDDEEVQELKSLINQQKNSKPIAAVQNNHQQQYTPQNWQKETAAYNPYEYDQEYDDSWINWDRKRNVQPKKVEHVKFANYPLKGITTTVKPKSDPTQKNGGQKEVVLPRPATPVRNPFAASALSSLQKPSSNENIEDPSRTKQSPTNIYDTIKQIIAMEQNLESAELKEELDQQKGRVQKRFVSNEETLVQQLDGLKRSA